MVGTKFLAKSGNVCDLFCPERSGDPGQPCFSQRGFLGPRTVEPWRDLPPDYGDWKNTHRRFYRWRDQGIRERLLDRVRDDPDFDWLMIDASYVKVHPNGTGARCCSQSMARTKGG